MALFKSPQIYEPIASCLRPKRCASFEQVSRMCLKSSELSAIWTGTGCMAKQILKAMSELDDVGMKESMLGVLPSSVGIVHQLAPDFDQRPDMWEDGASLRDIIKLLRTSGYDALANSVCNDLKSRACAEHLDAEHPDWYAYANGAHATFVASLSSILATAGCKVLLKYLVNLKHGSSFPRANLNALGSEGDLVGRFSFAEIEVLLCVDYMFDYLDEDGERPLSDLTVSELKLVAKAEGIKKAGTGWAASCPPNANKRAIIKAIEAKRAARAQMPLAEETSDAASSRRNHDYAGIVEDEVQNVSSPQQLESGSSGAQQHASSYPAQSTAQERESPILGLKDCEKDELALAERESAKEALLREQQDLHEALVRSKSDTVANRFALFRLQNCSNEIAQRLRDSEHLAPCFARCGDAGAEFDPRPEWAHGALLLVPITQQEIQEANWMLHAHHIVGTDGDVVLIRQALADIPKRQKRPKISEEHVGSTAAMCGGSVESRNLNDDSDYPDATELVVVNTFFTVRSVSRRSSASRSHSV